MPSPAPHQTTRTSPPSGGPNIHPGVLCFCSSDRRADFSRGTHRPHFRAKPRHSSGHPLFLFLSQAPSSIRASFAFVPEIGPDFSRGIPWPQELRALAPGTRPPTARRQTQRKPTTFVEVVVATRTSHDGRARLHPRHKKPPHPILSGPAAPSWGLDEGLPPATQSATSLAPEAINRRSQVKNSMSASA
jgi:hypothetical protein